MDVPTSGVLAMLTARAAALATAHTVPRLATARYLSSFSVSFITLSRSSRDTRMMQHAQDTVQRLAVLLPLLPTAEAIPEEMATNILRLARNTTANSDITCGEVLQGSILSILRELDERLTGAQLALWRPQTVVAALHTLARVSLAERLSMVDLLLFCAKEQLQQLDERRLVRLLWCIATLGLEKEHAALWKATCHRLVHLFNGLTGADRSLLVETLILITECMCDAQHELLCMLQNSRISRGDSDTLAGEEEFMRGDYQALKGHLLSEVHLLPTESIVALLSRMRDASSLSSGEDRESVDYLLQHLLLRRELKMDVCRELLELIAIIEPNEFTQLLRHHIIDCIRGVNHASCVQSDCLLTLDTVCIVVALEQQQTHDVCGATRALLVSLIRRCHDTHVVIQGRYSGRLAGTMAVALDLLTCCSIIPGDDVALAECSQRLEKFPIVWEQCGIASALLTECAACICGICELLRVSPLLRLIMTAKTARSATSGGSGGNRSGDASCRRVDALLHRCTDTLRRVVACFPTSLVFNIWRKAAAVMVEGNGGALQPLVELLLDYAEQHPPDFSLREVTHFMGTGRDYFPAEAFQLFLHRLSSERANVMPHHLEVLMTSLEAVAMRGDMALMERLQLMLFLRPLGHDVAMVHAIPFSTPQLVRLFHCCSFASDVAPSMQATVIELIVNSCSRCTSMEELNAAASLLLQLQHNPLKNPLAWAITEKGKSMPIEKTPDVQKALLVVYLRKSGCTVEESLLAALRRRRRRPA